MSTEKEAIAELYQNPDLLQRVLDLSKQQQAIESEILETEEYLKTLNEQLNRISGGHGVDGALPSLFQEVGLKKLELEGGIKIEIKDELKVPSMAREAETRQPMVNWLNENGHSGVVKNAVTIPFNKGEEERVKELEEFLAKAKFEYDKFSTVHPQTLKKIIGEILKDGEDIPMETLGIQEYKRSKVS